MAKTKMPEVPEIRIESTHVSFISDLHFGKYSSSEEWQKNMEDYFKKWFIPYMKKLKERCNDLVLVVLGDVYDDRKSIDIDVINLVIDLFEDIAEILPVYIIYGNHDLAKKTNKGNSSLRSIDNIKGITIITEPTLLRFIKDGKQVKKVIAIPYLGDTSEENKVLVSFNGHADYAFMHTDISSMKFDNGQTIVGGVDPEKFKGMIYSGHIHKRQETKRVVYVGSPYQLTRGEIGNQKGIYTLDVETNEREFEPNKFSPVFQRISVKEFMELFPHERYQMLENNYTDVQVEEDDLKNWKQQEIYDIFNTSSAKRAQLQILKSKANNEVKDEDFQELSIEDLIIGLIDKMDDVTPEQKESLKKLSNRYYKAAQEEIANL